MDSKYDCMGVNNSKANGSKRKQVMDNIKVKKTKLKTPNASSATKNASSATKNASSATKNVSSATKNASSATKNASKGKENGCNDAHDNKNMVDKESPQDLMEARRQLPVYMVRKRLIEEIKNNSTTIIIGETGSGKTTQIPQLIHERRLEGEGAIAITQPRRVAAISIAQRVAAELNTKVGLHVGYSVRFEDATSSATKVKYLTDGMLLREAMSDPLLIKYSIVILDEVHERTVNTDVLFGIVKLAQKQRNERKLTPLKLIIMSATMDVDTFSTYFNDCPVVYLEGRTFPVTIHHSKIKHDDYQYAAVCTMFQLHATTPADHDILVFLTGQEEIETMMHKVKEIAKECTGPPMRVYPLYAGLPASKQLQAWRSAPPGTRKIILATNIAEASITIPGIRCVIDSGVVKERTWCGSTGAERLTVRPCSQAAGWQRAGRAGRTAPGNAYRLYTESDFKARHQHHTPEIVRCPLASTLLLLITAGADPYTFPWIDAPPPDAVKASLALLKELGAIDNETKPKLTVLGKKMATFPIDPKYSKILLSATDYGCLDEALSLIAILSSEDIFQAPLHKRDESLMMKQKFQSPLGDHLTLLNVFKAFNKAQSKKQWCHEYFLNYKNLTYAAEVRRQLFDICQKLNMNVNSCGEDYEKLLKCLLCGLFTNCAWLRGVGTGARYVTAGGTAVALHPGGVLHALRPAPPVLLFTELLQTNRCYMITVSAIQPEWLHQVVPDYARRCRANR